MSFTVDQSHKKRLALVVLQPLRWRCVECAIRHEQDVREE